MPYVAPIVEGHGETLAVPALLHRLHLALASGDRLVVNPPFRVSAPKFVRNAGERDRTMRFAASKARQAGGIVLILLDGDLKAEEVCPARFGPRVMNEARMIAPDVPFLVVVAEREYESWFLAAGHSLRGQHGIAPDFSPPVDHASKRDAKGVLGAAMAGGYDPIRHQALLTRAMDLDEAARGNLSFRRMRDRLQTIWSAPE